MNSEPMNDVQQQFKRRIDRFGRARRRVANGRQTYAAGVAVLGVGITALLLLSGWIANPFVNCALTLVGVGLLIWQIVRLARRWEWRRETLSESFRMEDLAGDLNSRLISAVDFLKRPAPVAPLVAALIERACQDLDRPFEHLIERSARNRLRVRFMLLLVLFLLLGSGLISGFGFARMGRTVTLSAVELREILFPTRYELFPGTTICRIGTPIEVGLRFTRFGYPDVTMLKAASGREEVERSVLKADDSGRVVVKLESTVEREYRVRFAFGKRMTEEMTVVFTTTPMMENMQVELVYPLYTRLVPKESEGIVDRVTALPGTRVNMGFVFSKGLKSAVLTFDDTTRIPLDVVGRFASLSFVHALERGATLQVEDIHGFALDKPHVIDFGLTVDKPPKLIVPPFLKTDMPLTADELGGFTFGARVEDDFGAARCVVKWHKSTTDKPNQVKVKGEPIERIFIPPRPTVVAVFENIFREQAQTAEGDDLFTFQIEAFDNREPKAQSTVSASFSIFIRGQGSEGGTVGAGVDSITSRFPRDGGPRATRVYTPVGGSRVIGMPSKLDTTESGKNEFKSDRVTDSRREVTGARGETAGDYGKAFSGVK
jgi:hypothetical protein